MTGAVPVSQIDLRYYYEDTDRHGNVRRYFRKRIEGTKKYRKVRIRAELGTEEFHRQFAAALKGAKAQPTQSTAAEKTVPNSLRWLVEKYYASAAFKELEGSTREVRRRLLDNLCQEPRLEGQPGTLGTLPYSTQPTKSRCCGTAKPIGWIPPMDASKRCAACSPSRSPTSHPAEAKSGKRGRLPQKQKEGRLPHLVHRGGRNLS
jgi:hypothetical protein